MKRFEIADKNDTIKDAEGNDIYHAIIGDIYAENKELALQKLKASGLNSKDYTLTEITSVVYDNNVII